MTVFHLIVIAIITVTVVAIGWWIVTTITIILDGYSNAAFAVCVCVISISIACRRRTAAQSIEGSMPRVALHIVA